MVRSKIQISTYIISLRSSRLFTALSAILRSRWLSQVGGSYNHCIVVFRKKVFTWRNEKLTRSTRWCSQGGKVFSRGLSCDQNGPGTSLLYTFLFSGCWHNLVGQLSRTDLPDRFLQRGTGRSRAGTSLVTRRSTDLTAICKVFNWWTKIAPRQTSIASQRGQRLEQRMS